MSTDSAYRIEAGLELLNMAVEDDSLGTLYAVLEREIASSSRDIEEASRCEDEEYRDAVSDRESQHIEHLLGWAFLAAQTFIKTVTSRLMRLSKVCNEDVERSLSFVRSKFSDLLQLGDPMPNDCNYKDIEVINAVANYWKHHEEWPQCLIPSGEHLKRVWDQKQMSGNQKQTAEIVASIGMVPSLTGNLCAACEALGVTFPHEDLSPILNRLHRWASFLQKEARREVTAMLHHEELHP